MTTKVEDTENINNQFINYQTVDATLERERVEAREYLYRQMEAADCNGREQK